jgi:hypothetical protein
MDWHVGQLVRSALATVHRPCSTFSWTFGRPKARPCRSEFFNMFANSSENLTVCTTVRRLTPNDILIVRAARSFGTTT